MVHRRCERTIYSLYKRCAAHMLRASAKAGQPRHFRVMSVHGVGPVGSNGSDRQRLLQLVRVCDKLSVKWTGARVPTKSRREVGGYWYARHRVLLLTPHTRAVATKKAAALHARMATRGLTDHVLTLLYPPLEDGTSVVVPGARNTIETLMGIFCAAEISDIDDIQCGRLAQALSNLHAADREITFGILDKAIDDAWAAREAANAPYTAEAEAPHAAEAVAMEMSQARISEEPDGADTPQRVQAGRVPVVPLPERPDVVGRMSAEQIEDTLESWGLLQGGTLSDKRERLRAHVAGNTLVYSGYDDFKDWITPEQLQSMRLAGLPSSNIYDRLTAAAASADAGDLSKWEAMDTTESGGLPLGEQWIREPSGEGFVRMPSE